MSVPALTSTPAPAVPGPVAVPGTGTGFGALLASLVGDAAGDTPLAMPGPAAAAAPVATGSAEGEEAAPGEDVPGTVLTATPVVAPAYVVPPAAVPSSALPGEESGEPVVAVPAVSAAPAGAGERDVRLDGVPAPVMIPVPVVPASVEPAHASGQPAAAPQVSGAASESTPATAGPQAQLPSAPPERAPEQEPTQAPTQPAAAPAAPAAPSTGVAATSGEARPAAPVPVAQQLLPEVTRLVSRGNGVHRLSMTLQPEQLGEVRVTLTVRHGEVHVRLAAGEEAQRALVEGAPELRRFLELGGAADARVVVRDLAGTPTHQAPSPGSAGGPGGDAAAAREGSGGSHDQHAGTRAGTTARDGLTDGGTTPRPEPVTRPRSTGVDLTM